MAYVEVQATNADVYGGEPVFSNGECIGLTTSGDFALAVQKSLAFVYVKTPFAMPGTSFHIEILGERCQLTVLGEPAYDPQNERLRA